MAASQIGGTRHAQWHGRTDEPLWFARTCHTMEAHVSRESNPPNHVDGGPWSMHRAVAAISDEYEASCDNNDT